MVAFLFKIRNILLSFSHLCILNYATLRQYMYQDFKLFCTQTHPPHLFLFKYQIIFNLIFPKAEVFCLFTQSLDIIFPPPPSSNSVSINFKLNCKMLLWLIKSHVQNLNLWKSAK